MKSATHESQKNSKILNCWEFRKCGRQYGGSQVADLGVCPASVEKELDGIHGGKNGGRACWAIAGTLCEGMVQGTFAVKLRTCLVCDFYTLVQKEEGPDFQGFEKNLSKKWFV